MRSYVIIKNLIQRERKSQSERKRDNKRKVFLRKRERGRYIDRKRDIYIEKEKSIFIEFDINLVSVQQVLNVVGGKKVIF